MKRRGFMFLDTLAALLLVGGLATVLAVAAQMRQRVADRLGESIRLTAAAEMALTALQTGEKLAPREAGISIMPLDAAAPTGWKWARVTATWQGRSSDLVGLIPEGGR